MKELAAKLTNLDAAVTTFADQLTTKELAFTHATGESPTLSHDLCINKQALSQNHCLCYPHLP